jgi:type I restriction enzyme S subunit
MKPGYKQTEVGVIPEEWEVTTITDCCDYADYRGKTPPKTQSGTFLVTARNVRKGFIDYLDSQEFVPSALYDQIMRRGKPRIGDVLITTEAPLGNVAQIDCEDVALAQRIIKYRPKSDALSSTYLKHYFLSDRFQQVLDEHSSGSTAKGIKGRVLHKLPVVIPPPPEQRAIAEALSDVDGLLGGLDRLIAKKRDLKQAAMQELLTGQTRLPGFHGEWEETNLGEVATFLKGKGLPKSAISEHGAEPCIHYGELFTQYSETIRETLNRTNETRNCARSVANDVLMPTSDVTPRGLAKASCVLLDGIILGGDILIIRSDRNRVFGTFLSFVIRREENQVLQLVTGTTVYHLYGSEMRKFRFKLPPLPEQIAIAQILSDMDAELTALKQRREKTRALKQAMMQELLTGRTRLV